MIDPLDHRNLVFHVARRYQGLGLPLGDLISAGWLGLMHAVHHYDPARDARFSTYASPCISGTILREIRAWQWPVVVPEHAWVAARRLAAWKVDESRLTPGARSRLLFALRVMAIRGRMSLPDERTVRDPLLFRVADGNVPDPIDSLIRAELAECVHRAIDRLDGRYADILRSRFGIGRPEETFQSIGRRLGLSRERVRQIEMKAYDRLASHISGRPCPC